MVSTAPIYSWVCPAVYVNNAPSGLYPTLVNERIRATSAGELSEKKGSSYTLSFRLEPSIRRRGGSNGKADLLERFVGRGLFRFPARAGPNPALSAPRKPRLRTCKTILDEIQ